MKRFIQNQIIKTNLQRNINNNIYKNIYNQQYVEKQNNQLQHSLQLQQLQTFLQQQSSQSSYNSYDKHQAQIKKQLLTIDQSYQEIKNKSNIKHIHHIHQSKQSYQKQQQHKKQQLSQQQQQYHQIPSLFEPKNKNKNNIIKQMPINNQINKNLYSKPPKSNQKKNSNIVIKNQQSSVQNKSQQKPHSQFNHFNHTQFFLQSINDISNIQSASFLKHHCKTQSNLQCTFKPKILKKSLQIAQNLPNSFQRLTKENNTQQKIQYHHPPQRKYSQTRIQRLSQPKKVVQPPQQPLPSFKPNLSKTKIINRPITSNVVSRNQIWLEQRQAKLNKIRKQEENQKKKLQNSSYIPKIKQYKGQNDVNLSNFGKQGIANYFQRVSNASKNKQNNCLNRTNSKKNSLNMSKGKKEEKVVNANNFEKKECAKKTYENALKQLHSKIQNLKI